MAINRRRLVHSVKGQVRECEEGTAGRVNDNNSNEPNQTNWGLRCTQLQLGKLSEEAKWKALGTL